MTDVTSRMTKRESVLHFRGCVEITNCSVNRVTKSGCQPESHILEQVRQICAQESTAWRGTDRRRNIGHVSSFDLDLNGKYDDAYLGLAVHSVAGTQTIVD